MIRTFTSVVVLLGAALLAGAEEPTQFKTTTPDGRTVVVEFVTDQIVRVSNLPSADAVLKPSPLALKAPTRVTTTTFQVGPAETIITHSGLSVALNGLTGAVAINGGDGREIYENGVRTLSPAGEQRISIATMGQCAFYGGGERGYSFNLAGDTLVMYNRQNYGYTDGDPRIRQMNITMPLVISSDGYALLFDDFHPSKIIAENPLQYITENPEPVSYYFINGAGTLESVVKELSALTGRQDLPPVWSLGYITSKYGYHTEKQTREVVDSLKTAGYPVDGVVLDLYWYGKEQDMGRLEWEPSQWPDHKKMLADLKDQGVNTVIISQPYVLRNGRAIDNYNYLAPRGMFVADSTGTSPQEVKIWVGEGGMFDVANPDTRKWLANRYRELTDGGVTGWWGDLGEPEVHPETGRHANGLTARQYHNLYGNDWSSIIYDLFKEEYPDERLMTMMRGGTVGLQRYSVFPWSTDVSRSWGGLQPQVKIMLNSGLSGLGYMSHDVGGFAIDPAHPYDPELYVRWLQLGLFSPVLRTHSQEFAEPYLYPDQQDIVLPLIKDRYRWLPYNYTLAYENASQGLPLVRPLNFVDGPEAQPLDSITDQYLWGNNVMVAPVLTPGTTSRRIVFPAGKWVDMAHPDTVYDGGAVIDYPAPLSVLPLFVRAGSFIPMADYEMENTRDYRTDQYTVRYYPVAGVNSESTMYEDDCRSTRSLLDNNYSIIRFKGNAGEHTMVITATLEGSYTGMSPEKQMTFVVENVAGKPSRVEINGKRFKGFTYDSVARTLTIPAIWTVARPLSIVIER